MQLPRSVGTFDFGNWVYGLAAAFIGGGAGSFSAGVASMLVDPHDFNIYTPKFWMLISSTFVVNGLLHFFGYLHQQPLPAFKQVTTTTQTTESESKPPVVVTTVKEVQAVPISEQPKKEQ